MLALFAKNVSPGDIQERLLLLQEWTSMTQNPLIHESHKMVDTPIDSQECLNRWGCTCHGMDILRDPCTKDV